MPLIFLLTTFLFIPYAYTGVRIRAIFFAIPTTIKTIYAAVKFITERPADLKKFFFLTASRGKTVWPKTSACRLVALWSTMGLRRYCDKEDGKGYHKYQLQPNTGKIPSSIKQWRDKNGGTHAVMTTSMEYRYNIPKYGTLQAGDNYS